MAIHYRHSELREAYNLAADKYDEWMWQQFWRDREVPLVISQLLKQRSREFLDIGCGTGTYIAITKRIGWRGVGLDISEGMLSIAKKKLGNKFRLVQGDARLLPFKSRSFSTIMMTRVLSHIDDAPAVFTEISRVLKSSGTLIISDIHPHHDYEHTTLPTSEGKLPVETYKRDISEIIDLAWSFGKLKATYSSDVFSRFGDNVAIHWRHNRLEAESIVPQGFVACFHRA